MVGVMLNNFELSAHWLDLIPNWSGMTVSKHLLYFLFSSKKLTGATRYCFREDLFGNFSGRLHINERLKSSETKKLILMTS